MAQPNPFMPPSTDDLGAMPWGDLVDRYRGGTTRIERRLLALSDEQLDTFFRPEVGIGRWSCRVLVGHLADAELVYTHRLRRTVAEDHPVLGVWDENAFIDMGLYADPERGGHDRPAAAFVALIHTIRLFTAEWLRTLSDEQIARTALHPERGEESVRRMVEIATWHLEHHVAFLQRKLVHLLGHADETP